ncbi:MAG: redoxin domain-containing protein [Elusimicrobiota bacterium]
MFKKISVAVFCLITLSQFVSGAGEQKKKTEKNFQGLKAPNVRLEFYKPEGTLKTVSLEELTFSGNVVIFNFFDTACEPCKKELPLIESFYKKYKDSIKLYLICLDEKPNEVLPKWSAENKTTIPILVDPLGYRAGEKYGVTTYGTSSVPQIFIIGKSGKIGKHIRGYHENIDKILEEETLKLQKEVVVLPKKNVLHILYTNSANGYLESCDCPENPFGGLVRRVTAIKRLKAKFSESILVDSGDLFPARENALLSETCLKIMETLNYDAVGIGDQEFGVGSAFLKKNLERLPFISANLQTCDEKMCYPLAKPTIIKKISDLKIAVLSVIEPHVFDLFPAQKIKDIKVVDYYEYLKQTIPEIRKDADIVILVSHCGDDIDRKIAAEIPGIDVIVGGHSQTFHKDPLKTENSIIVQGGENGHRIGHLELKIDENKKIYSYTHEFVVLNKDIPDDPATAELIKQYKVDLKKSLQQIIVK